MLAYKDYSEGCTCLFAGLQKCADVIRHRGYVGFFIRCTSDKEAVAYLLNLAWSFLRISTRLTLPLMVFGSSSTNSTILGYL